METYSVDSVESDKSLKRELGQFIVGPLESAY